MSKLTLYTTKVPVKTTISQIHDILAGIGAQTIATDYLAGKAIGLRFSLLFEGKQIIFYLPTYYKGALEILQQKKGITKVMQTEEHALRVAWRIRKVWLESQVSLHAMQMADLVELFLPYTEIAPNVTLWKTYELKGLKQIIS